MRGVLIMKLVLIVLAALALGACCCFGDQLTDGPEIVLTASALWNEATPPIGSSATVDLYVMPEGAGEWTVIQFDAPYPIDPGTGALVDTFRFDYEVPLSGEKVTYRYELDLTVAGVLYAAADYPAELSCESGVWWWYFGGRIHCSELER
jgi:hypothetical protein